MHCFFFWEELFLLGWRAASAFTSLFFNLRPAYLGFALLFDPYLRLILSSPGVLQQLLSLDKLKLRPSI
ncbi:hypothetical protein D5086_024449 [Populus alba]|uniref:Uncharacterized protein n=1 Tax=Populus alba TaxID=43335 RepID=A0ACC4B666_POPAL